MFSRAASSDQPSGVTSNPHVGSSAAQPINMGFHKNDSAGVNGRFQGSSLSQSLRNSSGPWEGHPMAHRIVNPTVTTGVSISQPSSLGRHDPNSLASLALPIKQFMGKGLEQLHYDGNACSHRPQLAIQRELFTPGLRITMPCNEQQVNTDLQAMFSFRCIC